MACVLREGVTSRSTFSPYGTTVTADVLVEKVNDLTLKAHLEDLRSTVKYIELTDKMQLAAVSGARENGATWEQVAEALGVTHQAARQRWDRKLKALHNGDSA